MKLPILSVYKNIRHQKRSELISSVALLLALVEREITGRYRRSILGRGWMILQPLFYMVVFSSVREFLGISTGNTPYTIFSYAGLVPWTFFTSSLTRSATIIAGNISIIKKIAVRREIFPTVGVLTGFVDYLMSFVILICLAVWFRYYPTWMWLWLIPLTILLLLFSLGLCFIIAAIVPFQHDVSFGIPLLIQVWMYMSPIIYPLSNVPEKWLALYRLNPMIGIIEGFRNVIINGTPPDQGLLLVTVVATIGIWLIGPALYRYMSQYFTDVY